MRRNLLIFAACVIGTAFIHELGHGIGGWMQGIAVVPTPFKEYVLRPQVEWHEYVWIALGGVAASVAVTLGVILWFVRKDRSNGDVVLAAAVLAPTVYSIRYALVGRGHDAVEWQAAQSALGASPAGHAVDVVFVLLVVAGGVAWVARRRAAIRLPSVLRAAGLLIVGIIILVLGQVGNNALLDKSFPTMHVVGMPQEVQVSEGDE